MRQDVTTAIAGGAGTDPRSPGARLSDGAIDDIFVCDRTIGAAAALRAQSEAAIWRGVIVSTRRAWRWLGRAITPPARRTAAGG